MEDWQEWQLRADSIAQSLDGELKTLGADFFSTESDGNLRAFWPRFRELKERVRTAPAIRLEAKLELEQGLRVLGSRAYKAQESAFAESNRRKDELIAAIATLREPAEALHDARELRSLRRELDRTRAEFDAGTSLVSADRKVVWDSWREASQYVWQRLTGIWDENEAFLRTILADAQRFAEASDLDGVRQSVGRFFESLPTREAKQAAVVQMKSEAERLRRETELQRERKQVQRLSSQAAQMVPAVDGWKADVRRNREAIERLSGEVAGLEQQVRASTSILEQAMVRGSLVDKKRKLSEYERATRVLDQRIETAEEAPLMTAG